MTDTATSDNGGADPAPVGSVASFVRSYALRAPQIAWFLGAGASAAAGIPTAEQMIWEFKRELYASQEKRSPKVAEDLGSPQVRAFLQRFFDKSGAYPPRGAPDEYAHYFERCYPNESDRRVFLDGHVRGGRPSFGHTVLGSLMVAGSCEMVWTTNFDRTVEDAVAAQAGTTATLRVADIDAPQLAAQVVAERAFPLLVKLHGDFHSRALKNTSAELREQDALLRRVFVDELRRRGIAVVGYSGRDDSIMAAFEEVAQSGGFPGGLFWFYRADSPPAQRVQDLLAAVERRGGEAVAIPIGAFDELMGDVMRHLGRSVPHQPSTRPRLTGAPVPEATGTYPALRFNALPLIRLPQVARRIVCDIGGTREVREAIAETGASVIAVRTAAGVVGFGSDSEFKKLLHNRNVKSRDLHAIDVGRLHAEASELGLLSDALCAALCRERPLILHRRGRRKYLLPAPGEHEEHGDLRRIARAIVGVVPRTELRWSEAVQVRLDYRLERLWLLLEPTIVVDETDDEDLRSVRADFVRERLATRYNRNMNDFIAVWAAMIVAGDSSSCVRAFGISDGVDAEFEISATTAFSWRSPS